MEAPQIRRHSTSSNEYKIKRKGLSLGLDKLKLNRELSRGNYNPAFTQATIATRVALKARGWFDSNLCGRFDSVAGLVAETLSAYVYIALVEQR